MIFVNYSVIYPGKHYLILRISNIKEAITSLLTSFSKDFTYSVVESAEVALVNRIIGSINLVLTRMDPYVTKCLKIEWIYTSGNGGDNFISSPNSDTRIN
jgi:hypothetical protein